LKLELLAGVASGEQLDRAERLAGLSGGRRDGRPRVLVGDARGLGGRARGLYRGHALRHRGGLPGGGAPPAAAIALA